MSDPARVLFLPLYSLGGGGELARAIMIAEALRKESPNCDIRFVLPEDPGDRQDTSFPFLFPSDTGDDQTRSRLKAEFDRQTLLELQPDVAVFDSGVRSSVLRMCRNQGIRTVFVSARKHPQKKPFRPEWLRLLDAHWIIREDLFSPPYSRGQALLHRWIGRTRITVSDALFRNPDRQALTQQIDGFDKQDNRPLVLWTTGGGGYRIDGTPVGEIYTESALRIAQLHPVRCLVLAGPLHTGSLPSGNEHVRVVRALSPAAFAAALSQAHLAVTNGGQTVHQALALQTPCVAAPLGGYDQPIRINKYSDTGCIAAAEPNVRSLTAAATALLDEGSSARSSLLARMQQMDVSNALPELARQLHNMAQH
ncbi:glycosyltransferase family 4 protein [bacterium]|nr:glycosyltransferase family 4 protein [bacterium]